MEKIIHKVQIKNRRFKIGIFEQLLILIGIILLVNWFDKGDGLNKILSILPNNMYVITIGYFVFACFFIWLFYCGLNKLQAKGNKIIECTFYEKHIYFKGFYEHTLQYEKIKCIEIKKNKIIFYADQQFKARVLSFRENRVSNFAIEEAITNEIALDNIENMEETLEKLETLVSKDVFYVKPKKIVLRSPGTTQMVVATVLFAILGMLMGMLIWMASGENNTYFIISATIFTILGDLIYVIIYSNDLNKPCNKD